MRVVVQRVRDASVTADGRPVASIGEGLVAFVGFAAGEAPGDMLGRMASRLVRLRAFEDDAGKLTRSLQDVNGELLLIPQITLTASLDQGARPSFHTAATAEAAEHLFQAFVQAAQALHPKVLAGTFRAHMLITQTNDGPVTFILDSSTPACR